ncbi:MAG: hypothetical protein ABIL58_17630 [Pseudomonadota bacterium]
MDVGTKIKGLLKESELYRGQGLLNEAKGCLSQAATIIQSITNLKNKESLLSGISTKIKAVDMEIARVESAPDAPTMKAETQDLIKRLFSFSQKKDKAAQALDGAITLTKFGQYEKAIEEFTALLSQDAVRLAAAKNIIRCHIATSAIDNGIDQFKGWLRGELFSKDQLAKLKAFFQDILDKKGIDKKLPELEVPTVTVEEPQIEIEEKEEEILDINSIGLTFTTGPKKGEMVELDVSFQSGNVISVLITSHNKNLIENLKVGDKLDQVQFYSPIAIFQGSGIISAKTEIRVGPRKGDFSVDIKVSST